MKAKLVNWRVGAAIGVVVFGAMMFFPGHGVREIRESESLSNFALVEPRPRDDDWPCLRGAAGQNVATTNRLPTQWSFGEESGWDTSVPGIGHATPILWGDQLFLMTSEPGVPRIGLRSYSRGTGRPNWHTVLHQGGPASLLDKKVYSSSTPATDGQFVFAAAVVQETLWVTSVDFTGRIVWQHEAGSYRSKQGYASSPVVFKSLVIVAADQEQDSYLTAFHRQTGEIIWRVKRPNGESFGTPVVATISGRPQLVLAGKGAIVSYNPATGDTLWTFRWSAKRVATSVAFDANHVFATSSLPDSEVDCIKADGAGNVTKSHLIWRQTKVGSEVPSPVCHGGRLYVLADDGLLSCFETQTGKSLWRQRLEGRFSASPFITGDYLICSNLAGLTSIVKTGASSIVVATNSISEGVIASPVVAGDAIFFRTLTGLRRMGISPSVPIVERAEPSRRRL